MEGLDVRRFTCEPAYKVCYGVCDVLFWQSLHELRLMTSDPATQNMAIPGETGVERGKEGERQEAWGVQDIEFEIFSLCVRLSYRSVGLRTVKPNSFLIQSLSTSDTWSTKSD